MGKGNIITTLHVKTETGADVTFRSEGDTDTVFGFVALIIAYRPT
jgi:hypothetical protein